MQPKLTNSPPPQKKGQIIIWIKDQREEINSSYFENWNSSIAQISQPKLQQDIIQRNVLVKEKNVILQPEEKNEEKTKGNT